MKKLILSTFLTCAILLCTASSAFARWLIIVNVCPGGLQNGYTVEYVYIPGSGGDIVYVVENNDACGADMN